MVQSVQQDEMEDVVELEGMASEVSLVEWDPRVSLAYSVQSDCLVRREIEDGSEVLVRKVSLDTMEFRAKKDHQDYPEHQEKW